MRCQVVATCVVHHFMADQSLLTDPIPALIRRIALPASVGMFFNTMYNFVDTYCAGKISTDAQAALSMSFPIFFLVLAAGSGLQQASTALMSNALGSGDSKQARHLFAQAVLLSVIVGIVLSVVGYFASPALFRFLGAEGDYLSTSLAYMNVIMAGGVFFIMQMTLNSALNSQGDTRLYRNLLIGGFFANCLLNPWFMSGWLGFPAMGVAGIALATVLIQVVSCVILWRGIRRTELGAALQRSDFSPVQSLLSALAKQAIPAALNMLTVALGIFVITGFISHFGKEAVAAYGIATRIEQLMLLPIMGLNTAVLSLVGQNNGAGLAHRVRESWQTCIKLGVGFTLAAGVILWFLRQPMMEWFNPDPNVVRLGAEYLIIACVTLAAYPILFITVFMLQGLKKPTFGLWMGLYRQIVGQVGIIYLLAFGLAWGIWGVWIGISLVTWSGALFALWWGWRVVGKAA
jgi:putative MATE family efflux protein